MLDWLILSKRARRARRTRRRLKADYDAWEARGRTPPAPHLVKQRAVLEHAERFGLRVFVETGTYRGDMVEAVRITDRFDRLISIELGEELAEAACRRFAADPRVTILQGDSGARLAEVVAALDRPAVFWLDGHYSGAETARGEVDSPVVQELRHVYARPDAGQAVLIDDAREFTGQGGYPALDDLRALLAEIAPGVSVAVEHDIIRLTPPAHAPAR